MKRLDETRRDGSAFADWLRKELLAIGDATERTKRLTRRELGAYVMTNADLTDADLTRANLNIFDASPFVFDALAAVASAQIALKKTRIEWKNN